MNADLEHATTAALGPPHGGRVETKHTDPPCAACDARKVIETAKKAKLRDIGHTWECIATAKHNYGLCTCNDTDEEYDLPVWDASGFPHRAVEEAIAAERERCARIAEDCDCCTECSDATIAAAEIRNPAVRAAGLEVDRAYDALKAELGAAKVALAVQVLQASDGALAEVARLKAEIKELKALSKQQRLDLQEDKRDFGRLETVLAMARDERDAARAQVAVLTEGLNLIASWSEGPEVNASFDCPGCARTARETLTNAGVKQ